MFFVVFLVTIASPVFHCVTLHTCSIVNYASSLFGGFDRDYEALRVYVKVNLGGVENQLLCLFALFRFSL